MSLPPGASITTLGGKLCTMVPRDVVAGNDTSSNTAALTSLVAPAHPTSSSPAGSTAAAAVPTGPVVAAASSTTPDRSPSPDSSSGSATSAPVSTPPAATSQSTLLPASIEQVPSSASTASPESTIIPSSSTTSHAPSSQLPPGPALAVSHPGASQPAAASQPADPQSTDPQSADPQSADPQSASSTAITNVSSTSTSETPSISSSAVLQSETGGITNQISYSTGISSIATVPAVIPPTRAGAGAFPANTSETAPTGVTSATATNVGAAVGGAFGGLAVLGILLFLWWRYHKRKESHAPLLTSFDPRFSRHPSEKYEIDGSSLGPTPLGAKWKAQAGVLVSKLQANMTGLRFSLKGKFGGTSRSPSVDMNRGNSQFFERLPQHSRSTSAISGGTNKALKNKDSFRERCDRFKEKVCFNWRLHTRGFQPNNRPGGFGSNFEKESQRDLISPNFSQSVTVKDRELGQESVRHSRSISVGGAPIRGDLGLDFRRLSVNFSVPSPSAHPTIPDLTELPAVLTLNPFQDPVYTTSPSTFNPNTMDYLDSARRSRGISQPNITESVLGTRLPVNPQMNSILQSSRPSAAVAPTPPSRYPSTIRTSFDSNLDTVVSGYSLSGRKTRGRSDPFDLERPDLWRPAMPTASVRNSAVSRTSTRGVPEVMVQPRADNTRVGHMRIASTANSYTSSKYSSGVSDILTQWGDEGPDLGFPGSKGFSPEKGRPSSNIARMASRGGGNIQGAVGRAL